jgi:4-hydroxythreonine-4-phosphate dehydrogenase
MASVQRADVNLKAPIVLTQGDGAGIGPELALKAWLSRQTHALPAFGYIGSYAILAATAAQCGLDVPLQRSRPGEIADVFDHALPVLDEGLPASPVPILGAPDPQTGPLTISAIARAVALVMTGDARALVTNPIAKHVLYSAGFAFPGHTEFLAALATEAAKSVPPARAVMMLWSDTLAVVPVTIHIPLREVPDRLTVTEIVETGRIVAHDLTTRFAIATPRIAVAGLNPHAGENGAMGHEDQKVVAPAIAVLRAEGINAFGPLPADTMFHDRARSGYDAALCMYHDQALIPIKTLAFDDGVNVTLGLPFVRTSPDHGTAFDIAGRGIARPDSLIAAIRLADRMTREVRS